jgi:putative oxidoreductase
MYMPAPARDVLLLLARLLAGGIFIAHGWQKLSTIGISAVSASFRQSGVPLPTLSAWAAALIELVGGVALVIGLLTVVMSLLLALDMLGAYAFVHAGHGLFIANGGFELAGALAAAVLAFAAVGPGRFSVDEGLLGRARKGGHPVGRQRG